MVKWGTTTEEVRQFLFDYADENGGMSPTFREIGAAVGRASSVIFYHLRKLEAGGVIELRGEGKARHIHIVGSLYYLPISFSPRSMYEPHEPIKLELEQPDELALVTLKTAEEMLAVGGSLVPRDKDDLAEVSPI